MHAIIPHYFYKKSAALYASAPISFHYAEKLASPAERENAILTLHHQYNAHAIVLNTQPLSETFLRNLRPRSLLIRCGVGYDNIPLATCQKYKLLVAYTPDGPTQATVELTLAAMLALARNLPRHHANVLNGDWDVTKKTSSTSHHYRYYELQHKNLTILGNGRIGKKVAHLCQQAFAMNVTVWVKNLPPKQPHSPHIHYTTSLKKALSQADILSIHLPYTATTHHLLNEKTLGYLKESALIINTARGKIIDEAMLFARLKKGTLGGAALDVFSTEPYPHYARLRTIPRLLLTPHQGSNTLEAHERIATSIIEQITHYYRGEFEHLTWIPPMKDYSLQQAHFTPQPQRLASVASKQD